MIVCVNLPIHASIFLFLRARTYQAMYSQGLDRFCQAGIRECIPIYPMYTMMTGNHFLICENIWTFANKLAADLDLRLRMSSLHSDSDAVLKGCKKLSRSCRLGNSHPVRASSPGGRYPSKTKKKLHIHRYRDIVTSPAWSEGARFDLSGQ